MKLQFQDIERNKRRGLILIKVSVNRKSDGKSVA